MEAKKWYSLGRVLGKWYILGKKPNSSMEGLTLNAAEEEEISDSFLCCVCLELLYKPIVLSCGHISCFWCVHKSMNRVQESHCPICRRSYNHFPSISETLHSLLMKMYPVAYKNREDHILEEERKQDVFSPQFDCHRPGSHAEDEFGQKGDLKNYSRSGIESAAIKENNLAKDKMHKNDNNYFIEDLKCVTCKQLLFRPVVLNCGHVHCEGCVINPADKVLRCQECQIPDPRGFLKVCLVLDQFVEESFPKEYASRRDAVKHKQDLNNHEQANISSTEAKKQNFTLTSGDLPRSTHPRPRIHIAVGCDSCGMYPIIGDRYRCKDCMEAIGFDLCGDCYSTSSKLPGRFNQQHTPEHMFELMDMYTRVLRGFGTNTSGHLPASITRTDSLDDESDTSSEDMGIDWFHTHASSGGSQQNTSLTDNYVVENDAMLDGVEVLFSEINPSTSAMESQENIRPYLPASITRSDSSDDDNEYLNA